MPLGGNLCWCVCRCARHIMRAATGRLQNGWFGAVAQYCNCPFRILKRGPIARMNKYARILFVMYILSRVRKGGSKNTRE